MLEKYKDNFVKEIYTKFLDEVKEYGYCYISESYSNETEQLIRKITTPAIPYALAQWVQGERIAVNLS